MTNARATRTKRTSAATLPKQIKPEDLAVHRRMLARYKEAQQLALQAEELQAQARRLAAGFSVWAEDLHDRYGLDAGKGEGVQEDGTITRA